MIYIGCNYPMKEKILFLFIILFFSSEFAYLQPLSKNHFDYKSNKISYDSGMYWEELSTINSLRYPTKPSNISTDSLYFNHNYRISLKTNPKLNAYYYLSFKKFYYVYFDEVQNSGIGFQNDWAVLQICKGNADWGAGNNLALALNEKSKSYDYFLLHSNYGNLRVSYIHGYLETINTNINRYINARGIEWTNKKSIVIGLSETVVYSGENRALDIGYLTQ